jgi:hypothetical protein
MKILKEAAASEFFKINSNDNLFNLFAHCANRVLSLGGG